MGTVGDAALPLPDESVRPVRDRTSTAAVAQVISVTGIHPGGAFFVCVFGARKSATFRRARYERKDKRSAHTGVLMQRTAVNTSKYTYVEFVFFERDKNREEHD